MVPITPRAACCAEDAEGMVMELDARKALFVLQEEHGPRRSRYVASVGRQRGVVPMGGQASIRIHDLDRQVWADRPLVLART